MKGVVIAGLTIPRRTRWKKLSWGFYEFCANKALPTIKCVWPTVFVYRVMPERN